MVPSTDCGNNRHHICQGPRDPLHGVSTLVLCPVSIRTCQNPSAWGRGDYVAEVEGGVGDGKREGVNGRQIPNGIRISEE